MLLVLAISLVTLSARGATPMGPKRTDGSAGDGEGRYEYISFAGIPTEAQRAELRQHGVKVLRYVSEREKGKYTYLAFVSVDNTIKRQKVRGSAATIGRLSKGGSGLTVRFESYSWREKSEAQLAAAYDSKSVAGLPQWCIVGNGDAIRVTVSYVKEVGKREVQRALEALPFRVEFISKYGSYVQGEMKLSELPRIAEQPWVEMVRLASAPDELQNEQSAALIGVRKLQSTLGLGKGLTGKGVNVGVFDANVVSHTDFGSRLHVMETSQDKNFQSSHGTHVSGTVAGAGTLDPKAKGMAPEASLYTWNFSGSVSEKFGLAYANYGVRIAQNSYGAPLENQFGCNKTALAYNDQNKGIDEVLLAHPTLAANFSAGNSQSDCKRYEGGYVSSTRTAKNVITVGAVDAAGNMTNFSSWGPLKDGRMAPLICADGYGVWSTSYNNGYESMDGTSMACPAVSGLTALLYQQYRAENGGNDPQFILIKNALLNTADDAGCKGPDYQYGYGIVNGVRASDLLSEKRYAFGEVGNGDVNAAQKITVPANVSKLRVMIVWHEPSTQGNDKDLVNDLDLEVRGEKRVFQPWVLDPKNYTVLATRGRDGYNNHEQVEIDSPAAGEYTVVVTGYSVPDGKVPYSVTWEFDYAASALELTYPLGGETIIANDKYFFVRWTHAAPSSPVEVHISYDDGATWREVATVEPKKGLVKVAIEAGREFMEKVRVRVVQNGVFSASKQSFSIRPDLEIESVHTLCAQDPTIRWAKLGDGLTYSVAYYNEGSTGDRYELIKDNTTDTSCTITGYKESLPVSVKVCKGNFCSNYSTPVYPHGTRPVKIDLDKNRFVSFRMDDNGEIGNIYSWLDLGSETYAVHSRGLVLAYGDKDPDWKTPLEGDGSDVFEKNPAHVASLSVCLDLTAIKAEDLADYSLASIMTVVPMPKVSTTDPGGHSAWVRVVAHDVDGHNEVVLKNSQGVSVRNAGMTLAQLRGSDFDLSTYAGKRIVLRADAALKGSTSADINDAALVGGAQFAVMAKKDIALSALVLPASSEELGAQETVKVEFKNAAQLPLKQEEVTIRLYEGSTLLDESTTKLDMGGLSKTEYELPRKFDFTTPMHRYKLRAEVEMAGDANRKNNVKEASVTNLQGYILMPNLYRDPASGKEKEVVIGGEKRTFTDNMGPFDNMILTAANPLYPASKAASVGALKLKAEQAGKFVKITMKEVDLGKNHLDVYLSDGSYSKNLIYKFTEKEGAGVELSTQKAGEVLLFKYETKDAKQPVKGWVAEVEQVDAPVANVKNDLFEVLALEGEQGSGAGQRKMQMRYKNLSGKEQEHVRAGLFLSGWDGSTTKLCVDEFTVKADAGEQTHVFSQEVNLEKNEEVRLFALMDGGDAFIENNMRYARLYEGDYTPATTIKISGGGDFDYAGSQLVGVALGQESYTTEEVRKQTELHSYPQNFRKKVLRIAPEGKETLKLTVGKVHTSGVSVAVWVDWNNDKVFDENSELVGKISKDRSAKELSVELSVPQGVEGDRLMRIVVVDKQRTTVLLGANTECGEVEDYTLRIENIIAPVQIKDLALLYAELAEDGSAVKVQLRNNSTSEKLENIPLYVKVGENAEVEYPQTFTLAAGGAEAVREITLPLVQAQKDQLAVVGEHAVLVYHKYPEDMVPDNNQRLLYRSVKAPVAGKYVLTFDGTGGAAVMADFDESQMAAQTYEAWVRVDRFALDDGNPGLNRLFETPRMAAYFCGEGNTKLPANSVILLLSDGKIYKSPKNSVTLGKWMHVAVTADRSGATPVGKIYLNGVEVTEEHDNGAQLKTQGLVIGNRGDGNRSFIGAVDAFRVWSEVRSEDQIKESMNLRNASGAASGAALVAEFDFSEGAGSQKTASSDGKKFLTLSPSGVAWEKEPTLQALTWGVKGAKERQDDATNWSLSFAEAGAMASVELKPVSNLPDVKLKQGANAITGPIDLSSGEAQVTLEGEWLGETKSSTVTLHAYGPAVDAPKLKSLTVGGKPVTPIRSDMEVTLDGGADLSNVVLAFAVEPAGCVVKIGGKKIESGDKVDLSQTTLVDVYSASGFEKTTYQLTVTKEVAVTWAAATSPIEYTYGDEPSTPFDATVQGGGRVAYVVENQNVAQVVGNMLKINGAGSTKIKACAVMDGRMMAGGAEAMLTVKKAKLTVKAEDVAVDFLDPLPDKYRVTYSGFVYGENERDLTAPAKASCEAKQGNSAGTYPIKVEGAESPNYEITHVSGTLTIRDVAHCVVTFQLLAPVEQSSMQLAGLKLTVNGSEYTADSKGKVRVDLKKRAEAYAWSFNGSALNPKCEDEQGEVVADEAKTVDVQLRKYAERLKVHYVAEGGHGTVNEEPELTLEVRIGDPAPSVKAEANTGYEFAGWESTENDLNADQQKNAELTVSEVTKDGVTYTAKFDRKMYTVTYAVEGDGEIVGEATQTKLYGEMTEEVEAKATGTASFVGWNDGKMEAKRSDKVQGDKTYTARFVVAQPLPFTESFEDDSPTRGMWENAGEKGCEWKFLEQIGNYSLKKIGSGLAAGFELKEAPSGEQVKITLTTPVLDVRDREFVSVAYDYMGSLSSREKSKLLVEYSVGGAAFVELKAFTSMYSINVEKFSETIGESVIRDAKTLRLRWTFEGMGSSYPGSYILIDNLVVDGEPLANEYTLSYTVDASKGHLEVDGVNEGTNYSKTVARGEMGPKVKVVVEDQAKYEFKRWSDGSTDLERQDKADRGVDVTAEIGPNCGSPIVVTADKPYLEKFEGELTCWEMSAPSQGAEWKNKDSIYIDNAGMGYSAAPQTMTLVSPLYDLSALTSATVKFKYTFVDFLENRNYFKLFYSTDGGRTWNTKPLLDLKPNELADNVTFAEELPSLSDKVRFKWEGTVTRMMSKPFVMDDFSISGTGTSQPGSFTYSVVTEPADLAGAGAAVTNADGTPLASQTLTAGQEIKVVANEVTGYTAAVTVEGADDKGNGLYTVTGNVTITVEYTKKAQPGSFTYNVVTDPVDLQGAGAAVTNEDGTPLASQTLTAGQVIKVVAKEVAGYTAEVTTVEGADAKGHGLYTVTGNVTITVKYTKKVQPGSFTYNVVTDPVDLQGAGVAVTNGDGTPLASQTLTAGQVIKVVAKEVTGHTAEVTTVEGADAKGDGLYTVSGNVTITVKYTKKASTPVESLALRQVSLRPNPASTVLYVDNASEVTQLTVVSLQGVAIARYENAAGASTVRLPLIGLAEGVYCLVVEDGEGRRVIPFVVRN